MSFDDELRHALRAEAGRYDPADDGWDGITAGVHAARTRRRRLGGGVLGVAAVALVALAIGFDAGDDAVTDVRTAPAADEPDLASPPPPATPKSPTTSPTSTTTTASEPAGTAVPFFDGIWPFASQQEVDGYDEVDGPYEDPFATADAFARQYLGMLDPVVGDAVGEDDGTTPVEVRPRGEDGSPVPDGGPLTTLILRPHQVRPGAWVWTVVSARSPNIVVDAPTGVGAEPLARYGSPLAVSGQATGYEGSVVAEVREDGMVAGQALGRAIGIAGNFGQLGPMDLTVPFSSPTTPGGALVVTTDTGRDGVGVPEATVVRLDFAPGETAGTPEGAGAPCAPPAPEGEPAPDEMEVTVYFSCGGEPTFVGVTRIVPRSAGVLQATLDQLVAGPTPRERAAGLGSFFSSRTADILAGVDLADGTAVVDFADVVDNASTSAGQVLFRGELNHTVLQFPTVERVEYRLLGSCESFGNWQQVGECITATRGDLHD